MWDCEKSSCFSISKINPAERGKFLNLFITFVYWRHGKCEEMLIWTEALPHVLWNLWNYLTEPQLLRRPLQHAGHLQINIRQRAGVDSGIKIKTNGTFFPPSKSTSDESKGPKRGRHIQKKSRQTEKERSNPFKNSIIKKFPQFPPYQK